MARKDILKFPNGHRIGPYLLVNSDTGRANSHIRPIGSGGSAFVYKAVQSLAVGAEIYRAVKIFKLRDDIAKKRRESNQTDGIHGFLGEIITVSTINHQNIVKIIDAGRDQDDRPFFVMEYVDGPTLEQLTERNSERCHMWAEAAKKNPFLVLDICQQVCAALAYLHDQDRYHFDIAPKNIFVRGSPDKPHILIGDLGVSRTLVNAPDIMEIAGTRDFTPPELQTYRESGFVPLNVLAGAAAYWDLFALCKVAQKLMDAWAVRDTKELRPLNILCDRIVAANLGLRADRLAIELDRLRPDHVRTVGVEELSNDAVGTYRYVTLPIRQVPLSHRMVRIFEHHTLTRLQQVPQLMLYRSAHPGGVHTVYEHLLGSYGLMVRAITKLLGRPEFRASFSEKELEEALLAIALSRVGSFPLERIIWSKRPMTPDEKIEDLRESLDWNSGDHRTLNAVLSNDFGSADISSVLDIICRPKDELKFPYQKIISSLIRSSIDVRVMDYIVRDSYHTGIPAGDGIDIDHILDSMIWIPNNNVIGISRKGVFSCEHLLCARYWMFARLYWNIPNRSTTAMLRHVIFDLLEEGKQSPEALTIELRGTDEASALAKIAEKTSKTKSVDRGDVSIIELLQMPRPRNYAILLEKFALNWDEKERDVKRGLAAVAKIEALGVGGLHALEREYFERSGFKSQIKRSQIVFDFTEENPLKLGEDILVKVGKSDYQSLENSSHIVRALPNAFNESAVRFRAFVHPEIRGELKLNIARELNEFLNEKFW